MAATDGLPIPNAAAPEASGRRRAAGRIVVGVDGSPASLAALEWAAAEAGYRRAALRIVAAWDDPDRGPACHASSARASAAAALAQDALDLVVGLDGHIARVSCVVPAGEPGRVLVEQAREAEMLILGAAPGLEQGSTLRYCLRFAPCPLVFVRA